MVCRLIPLSEFSTIASAWDAINQEYYAHPLMESRFVSAAVEHFSTGTELIAVWGELNKPDAIAIVKGAKLGVWSTFQPSQAPLGAFIQRPFIKLPVLIAELFTQLPFSCQIMSILQQDPDILPRPDPQSTLRTLNYIETARISVNCSFEEYWAGRGKNLRHNIKRQCNRVAREEVELRLEVLKRPEEISEGIRSYGKLESLGWKAKGGTAVNLDNEQGQFYTKMLTHYATTGDARIYRYYYNEKLTAIDLCILNTSALVILKTTYDESVKTSSPALLMRHEYFQPIFNNREVKRIEFYGKVMDWHTKWSDEIRTMYHINSYRASVISKLHSRSWD